MGLLNAARRFLSKSITKIKATQIKHDVFTLAASSPGIANISLDASTKLVKYHRHVPGTRDTDGWRGEVESRKIRRVGLSRRARAARLLGAGLGPPVGERSVLHSQPPTNCAKYLGEHQQCYSKDLPPSVNCVICNLWLVIPNKNPKKA